MSAPSVNIVSPLLNGQVIDSTNGIIILQIISIHRFYSDLSLHCYLIPPSTTLPTDAYEVVLSDGVYKGKFLLDPILHHYAYQNELQPFRFIQIKGYAQRFDESSSRGKLTVVLHDIMPLDGRWISINISPIYVYIFLQYLFILK